MATKPLSWQELIMSVCVTSPLFHPLVNGHWSSWQPWDECSVTCGNGIRTRVRFCDSPPPQYRGRGCEGSPSQQAECTMQNCPVDGKYGSWTNWQPCSTTCGSGEQIRTRQCNNPAPRNFGRDCLGPSEHKRMCSEGDCPIDGSWMDWSAWSSCSRSCNRGSRTRSRICKEPKNNGRVCIGNNIEQDVCNVERCPVHGNWSPWEAWSSCSASCNGGRQFRQRSCSRPSPQYNGRRCPGNSREIRICNKEECRRNGNWSPWSAWGPCSQTCGDSQSVRSHTCDNPPPVNGGLPCVGQPTQVRKCNVPACIGGPIEAVAEVSGNINGEKFGKTLLIANVSSESRGYSIVTAKMFNIRNSVGSALRYLLSLISPIYWTSAYEVGNAVNGFTLTQGNFQRETRVVFGSGETLDIRYRINGVDADGILQLGMTVTGDVPVFQAEDVVAFRPYKEDYIQTGPGELFARSQRMFTVNGLAMPYSWSHQINYDRRAHSMPFLVETLRTRALQSNYNPLEQTMEYAVQVSIEEGSPSNQCPDGFFFDQIGPYCRDEDECAQNGICHHTCENTPGHYRCSCYNGYKLSRDKICTDINECETIPDLCPAHKDCQNIAGSHICLVKCRHGYKRSVAGVTCVDVNECDETQGLCEHQCQNTLGSYRCSCLRGYDSRGSTCIDIDECQWRNSCPLPDQQCTNTQGSFNCITVCQSGFERSSDGTCTDINECSNSNLNRCSRHQTCENTYGSYTCMCPRGYRMERNICLDINECLLNPCVYECRNTDGSYECICLEGMLRLNDRKTCIGNPLRPSEPLTSSTRCQSGYRETQQGCLDVDECLEGPKMNFKFCQGYCHNTDGSYRCSCPQGYRLHSDRKSCQDINECTERNDCGRNRLCFNMLGSYECVHIRCPEHYRRLEVDTSEGTQYSCIKDCSKAECKYLENIIWFKTFAVSRELADWPTRYLFIMKVIKSDGTEEKNVNFEIVDRDISEQQCNCKLPFEIREEYGKTYVSTTAPLNEPKRYELVVKASISDQNNDFEYATREVIYISVSAYPY